MMKLWQFVIACACAFVLIVSCDTAYAGSWGYNQTFSTYSEDQNFTGVYSYVSSGYWYCSGGYSSRGGHADSYRYDSRTTDKMSLHLGSWVDNPSITSTYSHYMYFYFNSATPTDGTLSFWWETSNASITLQYQVGGSAWAYTVASSGSTSSNQTYSRTLPKGTTMFMLYSSSMPNTTTGAWIDSISYSLATPIFPTGISGYDKTGSNSGVLNLIASWDYDSYVGALSPSYFDWQYRWSSDSPDYWRNADGYYNGDYYTLIDTGKKHDLAFRVRNRLVSVYGESEWYDVTLKVMNPGLREFSITGGEPAGGVIDLAAEAEVPTFTGVWFPPNPWKYVSANSCNNPINLLMVNPISLVGSSAHIFQYETNFQQMAGTPTFKLKLWKRVSGTTYTEIASTFETPTVQGLTYYDTSWDIGPDTHMGGFYRYLWQGGNPSYTGNNPMSYYYSTSSTEFAGTYSWPTSTCTDTYIIPIRMKMDMPSPDVNGAKFRYKIGQDGEPTDIGDATYSPSDGKWHAQWSSWDIDSEEVYFEATFNIDGQWTNWEADGPFNIRNHVYHTFQTALAGSGPGPGQIYVQDFGYIPSGTQVSIQVYKSVGISASDYVFDTFNKRWRFESWSDGGNQTHIITTAPSTPNTVFTANYIRQFHFVIDSLRDDYISSTQGWYEAGQQIKCTISRYSYVIAGQSRYECKGYEVYYNDSSVPTYTNGTLEFEETISKDTRVKILWESQFYFAVVDDRFTGTGTLPGWYKVGSQINYSVQMYINNGENARLRCSGYMRVGTFIPDTITINEPITAPMLIDWEWVQQFYVTAQTNVGTISPTDFWEDENNEVTFTAVSGTEPLARFNFAEWTGTGRGVVRLIGGEPIATATVGSPINQIAVWDIEYQLLLQSNIGTFSVAVDAWYSPGQSVQVSAYPPNSTEGQRYLPYWWSFSEYGFNANPEENTPTSHTFVMNRGISQNLDWQEQFRLIITNESGLGQTFPEAGTYWYFTGEEVIGYAVNATKENICAGFTGTGSYQSSTMPYFRGPIESPSTVSWLFRGRLAQPGFGLGTANALSTNGPVAFAKTDNGNAIAYVNTSGELIYATWNGTVWQPTVVATGVGTITSIDLFASFGYPVIVCHVLGTTGLTARYYYPTMNVPTAPGVGFEEYINTNPSEGGINPHVAVSVEGFIYISSYSSNGSLMLTTITTNGTVTTEVVDNEGNPGFYNDIGVNPITGMPVIVYYDSFTRRLKIAYLTDGGWTKMVVDDAGNVGSECKILIGNSGDIYIAYRDITRADKMNVKVAKITLGIITKVIVDNYGAVGSGVGFAMGSEECPHITYFSPNTLRLTRFNGTNWEIYTVVRNVTPSGMSAIEVLNDGRPVFAYKSGDTTYIVVGQAGSMQPDSVSGGSPGLVTKSSGGGGGCFIATAAFGSMSSDSVASLCAMRDSGISASNCGASLTSLYYAVSPSVADYFSSGARSLIQSLLK